MTELDIGFSQSQGDRSYQEDAWGKVVWPNGFTLALLSDGMGGAVAGETASNEMLEAFKESFIESTEPSIKLRLKESLIDANTHLQGLIKADSSLDGMGGTIIATAFTGEKIVWVSVGDSPLWLVRKGEISQINENHSRWAELLKLVESGKMTQEELDQHPERNQLTSAVMGYEIEQVDIGEAEVDVDDWILLASDGVETLTEKEINLLCSRPGWDSAQSLAEHLIQQVDKVERPGQDNSSVIALHVNGKDES